MQSNWTEKDTPASNRAERCIQGLKNSTRKDMVEADSPLVFWDYCIERRAIIEQSIAKDNHLLKGSMPHSVMIGEMTDISNICNFKWYKWVKFRKPDESYPFPSEWLRRCLGPAVNKGNAMSQHILTENGEVVTAQMVKKLLPSEIRSPSELKKRIKMDEYIRKRYGDSRSTPDNWVKWRQKPGDPVQYEDTSEEDPAEEPYSDSVNGKTHTLPEVDTISDLDLYINAEVLLPKDGEHMQAARVDEREMKIVMWLESIMWIQS